MKIVFKPYKNGLKGLGLIKENIKELGYKCLETKVVNSKYKQKKGDVVFSWGISIGKIEQFLNFSIWNVPHPEWSVNKHHAEDFINQGKRVLCRTIENGHGGAGIVIANTVEELVDAPLYTVYTPKKREFRAHVFRGDEDVYYIAEKKMRNKVDRPENFNKYIRNHDNGWVFIKNPEDIPLDIHVACSKAVQSLGYEFGAVDIGWHPDTGACIYEVNSAPGCDNTTAEWYANNFIRSIA